MLLFASPIIVCGLFVLYIDPFNYFELFKQIPVKVKKEIVWRYNSVLWTSIDYAHSPCPNIILGDSRADRISVDYLKQKTGKQYKQLTATACKINEIADYFWFANSKTKLESVYIILNFNMFNMYAFANRIVGAEAAIKNPLLYVFDRNVTEASYSVFKYVYLNKTNIVKNPAANKDDFWTWSLNKWPYQQYGKWKYPVNAYQRLKEISEYCRREHIDLVFIITPHHVDYQKKVTEFMLDNEQAKFKYDIAQLATTFDFDLDNEITRNRDNFSDPVHFEKTDLMIDEIFSGKLHYGKLLAAGR